MRLAALDALEESKRVVTADREVAAALLIGAGASGRMADALDWFEVTLFTMNGNVTEWTVAECVTDEM